MKVEVTQEDINLGCRMRTLDCPVARAVTRAAGLPASVHWNRILIFEEGSDLRLGGCREQVVKAWETPAEVKWQVMLFDDGHPIRPFEFEL